MMMMTNINTEQHHMATVNHHQGQLIAPDSFSVIKVSASSAKSWNTRLGLFAVPDHIDLVDVRAALEALPGVDRVHDLHVWATGTSDVVLTAHLVMPGGTPTTRSSKPPRTSCASASGSAT